MTCAPVLQTYNTAEYETFSEALKVFMSSAGVTPDEIETCCIACAGPVIGNVCDMTNLRWLVDGNALEAEFGFRFSVRTASDVVFTAAQPLMEQHLCSKCVYEWHVLIDMS